MTDQGTQKTELKITDAQTGDLLQKLTTACPPIQKSTGELDVNKGRIANGGGLDNHELGIISNLAAARGVTFDAVKSLAEVGMLEGQGIMNYGQEVGKACTAFNKK